MKNVILLILCFFFIGLTVRLSAQNLMSQAAQIEKERSPILLPSYVQFDVAKAPAFSEKPDFINLFVGASASATAQLMRKENDDLGFTHYRYQQTLHNVPIEGAEYLYHVKNGKVLTANGFWLTEDALKTIERKTRDQVTENAAFKAALLYINADQYKWDLPEEEALLKKETGDKMATFLPKGEKVFVKYTEEWQTSGIRLAWKFDIYAHEPMSRRFIFIDAENGRVLTEIEQIHNTDVSGTAATAYSGTKTIVSDNYGTGLYRLRESANGLGRGKGINTYNLKNKTNYGGAVDFTNSSATWTTTGANQFALDAHFGAEATYDYYKLIHNRNSIDNAGFAINSYVHYSRNYVNAFWDGSRMTYGDGSGSVTPLTALDVCGHEITHGLTSKTANLTYSNESGALNESFSDIFGTAVEFFAKPTNGQGNWTIGEDMNYIIRNMANPNQFSDPDTYKGTYWYAGTSDNGGVHTNSGVQNYWFYLLTQGGSGTNDKGTAFSVTGLGIDKAAKITFRSLTVYLTSAAQYANARTQAIQAATDLYGATSTEVIQTTNAWCAVGVGACVPAGAPAQGSVAANNNTNTYHNGLKDAALMATLSPNPARGVVNLTMASLSDGEARILITNTLGQAMWSKNSYMNKGETKQTIDVSQWAKGFYTVRIQQGTNIKTEKLVID